MNTSVTEAETREPTLSAESRQNTKNKTKDVRVSRLNSPAAITSTCLKTSTVKCGFNSSNFYKLTCTTVSFSLFSAGDVSAPSFLSRQEICFCSSQPLIVGNHISISWFKTTCTIFFSCYLWWLQLRRKMMNWSLFSKSYIRYRDETWNHTSPVFWGHFWKQPFLLSYQDIRRVYAFMRSCWHCVPSTTTSELWSVQSPFHFLDLDQVRTRSSGS